MTVKEAVELAVKALEVDDIGEVLADNWTDSEIAEATRKASEAVSVLQTIG